jgi:uncharacterized protein
MAVEYDPAKDALNVSKHGVSLKMAAELDVEGVVEDRRRNYGEPRFNAFGLIHGVAYCLTYTMRDGVVRAISLRRARDKEYRRHVV